MWIVTAKTLGDALGRQCCSFFLIMAAWLACPTWLGSKRQEGQGQSAFPGSFPGWVLCGCTTVLWAETHQGQTIQFPLDDFCDLFQLALSQSDVTKSSPQQDVALLVPVAPSPWWASSQSISSHLSLLEGNETPPKMSGKGTSCREQTLGTRY